MWTSRHGYKRLLCYFDVPAEACTELEDKLTEVLMHRFGIRNVRGGNYVNCRNDCYDNDWWYPESLRLGHVPTLHYRPVSKFPLELGRLVDAFETFCGFQNSCQDASAWCS